MANYSMQSLTVPSRFGGYEIMEFLGNGGMGDVYKAKHLEMDRIVALKMLPTRLTSDQDIERFNSEALAISRMEHQNIVSIYDYGQIRSRKYIAMQFIEGRTLADVIKQERALDYPRTIHIAKQVARGIKYAHEKNVIHRDVKPGNIMIDSLDRAFLSDFGIAQLPDTARLTTTGMAMGTPEYMAPEQCEGKDLDSQCDIYSFGIVMYEMIAGRPPFMGSNPVSIAYQQVHEIPPLVSKWRKDVPATLDLIVAKCLKKHKSERYHSAEELLIDMDRIPVLRPSTKISLATIVHKKDDSRITERRSDNRRAKAKPFTIVYRTLLAVLLAGLVAYCFYLHRQITKMNKGSEASFSLISNLS